MRFSFGRPVVGALARRKSTLMMMMMLLCRIVTVRGNNLACQQCNLTYSRCVIECSGYGSQFPDALQMGQAYTLCVRLCTQQFNMCAVVNCVGGGVVVTEEEQEFLDKCIQALAVANANRDDFLTLDEFQAHTTAWTELFCPDQKAAAAVTLSQEEYYDYATIQNFFKNLGCALCSGLLDPYNPRAEERDFASCGCTPTANALPIRLSAQTNVEAGLYCAIAFEMVFVQCEQPLPTCLQDCQGDRDACVDNRCGDFYGRDDFLIKCLQTCDPPFYTCVEACE